VSGNSADAANNRAGEKPKTLIIMYSSNINLMPLMTIAISIFDYGIMFQKNPILSI
jgi:hypothetical protein